MHGWAAKREQASETSREAGEVERGSSGTREETVPGGDPEGCRRHSGGSRIARDEHGRGKKEGLTIDGEVVDNPKRGNGGHRWVGEGGAVEGQQMGGADDGDRTGRGRLGEGPVTGVARTMTRLWPRGPVTRLFPNARQAAELRQLGSCAQLHGARSWQLC